MTWYAFRYSSAFFFHIGSGSSDRRLPFQIRWHVTFLSWIATDSVRAVYFMLLVKEEKTHFALDFCCCFLIHTFFHCEHEAWVSVCACLKRKKEKISQNYLAHTHSHTDRIVYMVRRRMFLVVVVFCEKKKQRNHHKWNNL